MAGSFWGATEYGCYFVGSYLGRLYYSFLERLMSFFIPIRLYILLRNTYLLL